MNKESRKKLIECLLWAILIALFIPIFFDACHNIYLRFKELNGTVSASERDYLEEQRRLARKYWW